MNAGSEGCPEAIGKTAAAPSKNTNSEAKPRLGREWVTYCAPSWARDGNSEGDDSDAEDPDDEGRDDGETSCGQPDCKCGKPLSQNPSWPWFISKRGFELAMKWQ